MGIDGILRINRYLVYQYWLDPRSVIELLIQWAFQYYALKRTRTSTLFSTRFWVSRVYHFTTKASWKWIVFHEYDIYLVWYMEYMTKVEFWSISIDRSCHIGPSRTSNCFDLNYPEDTLYISKRCTIKPISRFNRSPKKLIWYPNNDRYVKSRSDYAYS